MRSFGDVMHEWLYGEYGYYKSAKIGKGGDFYTSVSASRYFGATIANAFVRFCLGAKSSVSCMPNKNLTKSPSEDNRIVFMEIGAARGELIIDVARYLLQFHEKIAQNTSFVVIEPFSELRDEQRTNWDAVCKNMELLILDSLDKFRAKNVFVFANELLDALPCELFLDDKQGFVAEDFSVRFLNASDEIKMRAAKLNLVRGELAVGLDKIVSEISNCAENLLFLTFDYGQNFARNDFSIRLFRGHEVLNFADFKDNIRPFFGLCDITSDVNFDEVRLEFEKNGMRQIYFNRQNRALFELGISDVIQNLTQEESKIYKSDNTCYSNGLKPETKHQYENDDTKNMREILSVRSLLDPGLLGERFKCACFIKGECGNPFSGL